MPPQITGLSLGRRPPVAKEREESCSGSHFTSGWMRSMTSEVILGVSGSARTPLATIILSEKTATFVFRD